MERRYISAVKPLCQYILQVDFVSGSRLLLDMKPYLDKFRFRPLTDLQTWNSCDERHFYPFRKCGVEP